MIWAVLGIYGYEIKVSVSDLNSDNKLSYAANKNYIVVNNEVYNWLTQKNENGLLANTPKHSLGGFGIILYNPSQTDHLIIKTRCSTHQLGLGEKIELLEAIAKSACRDAAKWWE